MKRAATLWALGVVPSRKTPAALGHDLDTDVGLDTPNASVTISHINKASRLSGNPRVPQGADIAKFREAAAADFPSVAPPGGPRVPAGFTVSVTVIPKKRSDTWKNELEVELTVDVGPEGVPRCSRVVITTSAPPDSIGQDVLRSIPVGKVLRWAVRWFASSDRADMERSWNSALRPQTFAPTEGNLRRVATIVRTHILDAAALGIGRPNPNDKVAKDLIISRATAARRIRQAKDKGYLPEDLATIVHDELANKDRRNKR